MGIAFSFAMGFLKNILRIGKAEPQAVDSQKPTERRLTIYNDLESVNLEALREGNAEALKELALQKIMPPYVTKHSHVYSESKDHMTPLRIRDTHPNVLAALAIAQTKPHDSAKAELISQMGAKVAKSFHDLHYQENGNLFEYDLRDALVRQVGLEIGVSSALVANKKTGIFTRECRERINQICQKPIYGGASQALDRFWQSGRRLHEEEEAKLQKFSSLKETTPSFGKTPGLGRDALVK